MSVYDDMERSYGDTVRGFASYLHRNPELSFKEYNTTAALKELLEGAGIEILDLGLETGLVGIIRGGNGKKVALRADIDAIHQHEQCDRADKSAVDGVMHGCGHDIHTASLLGAALYLNSIGDKLRGDVLLIFQPAEETLKGARYLIDHGLWEHFKPDMLFGLHNYPPLPIGTVGLRKGELMSFKDGFEIRYLGKSGHTSTPQKNIDPTVAISSLILSMQSIVSRNVGPLEQAVVTVCSIRSGEPFTTTIDDAVITGNIRTVSADVRTRVLARLTALAENTAAAYGCTPELNIFEITPGVINSSELYPTAYSASEAVFGSENIKTPSVNMASEDFSILGRECPYFFYYLGSGFPDRNNEPWHNPMFNTPPDVPVYGAALLASSVIKAQE